MPADNRQPFRRPAPRPFRGRPQRPVGPATIAPSEPESPAHRRQLLKATYHRLARLAHVPVAELVAADPEKLLSIAVSGAASTGGQGDARRLATKVIRLRG